MAAVAPAEGASIKGSVANGTGAELAEPVTVSLVCFGEVGGEWIADDGRGGFLFKDLPSGPDNPFLLQAAYLGISYSSQFRLGAGVDTALTVEVFETTTSAEGVGVEEMEIDLTRMEDRLRVDQVMRVMNTSDPPRTVLGGEGTSFHLFLPVPAEEAGNLFLAASRGIVPVRREPIPTGREKEVAIDYPLRPGFTALAASFDVSYPEEWEYVAVLPYEIPRIVVVAQEEMAFSGEGFLPAHAGGEGLAVYTSEGGTPGMEIRFKVSGGSSVPPERTGGGKPSGSVFVGPHPFSEVQPVIILLVGGVLFAALVVATRAYPGGRVR
jgi:hypothetical protein